MTRIMTLTPLLAAVLATACQQAAAAHERRDFIEIQIDHEQSILETMLYRLVTTMRDDSFVDTTVHASSSIPKCWATANALLAPSSWKP